MLIGLFVVTVDIFLFQHFLFVMQQFILSVFFVSQSVGLKIFRTFCKRWLKLLLSPFDTLRC